MLEAQRDRGEPLPDIDAFGSGEAGQAVRWGWGRVRVRVRVWVWARVRVEAIS